MPAGFVRRSHRDGTVANTQTIRKTATACDQNTALIGIAKRRELAARRRQ